MSAWYPYIPHFLTSLRMISPIVIIPLYLDGYWMSLPIVVGLVFATDWLDGHLARKYGWTSESGTWFDPLADKSPCVCLMALILGHYEFNAMIAMPIALIVLYDVSTMTARAMGIVVAASFIAKAKTAMLMFSLWNFSAAFGLENYGEYVNDFTISTLWLVAAMCAWSGYTYFQGYVRTA